MDARMNGADQPPFIQHSRMKIAVQVSIRLVGTPQGLITCKPDPDYVQKVFRVGRPIPKSLSMWWRPGSPWM